MNIFTTFALKRAMTAGFTIVLALCLNFYSMSHEGWIILSAFLVSQTTRGTMLRQGLVYLLLIIAALLIVSVMALLAEKEIVFLSVIVVWWLAHFIIFKNRPLPTRILYLNICFFTVFVFAAMQPENASISTRMMDVILGTLLGIICGQFIFPIKFEQEFKQGVLPALTLLADCMLQFAKGFGNFHESKTCQVASISQIEPAIYPEWVYEAGFNPGLRSGFRFFLINLERIMDLFSSLNYLTREPIENELLHQLSSEMSTSMEKNHELVMVLIQYFQNQKLIIPQSDFTSDMTVLENKLQEVVPTSLELIDISPDYVVLIAIVRDMKDLRTLLLQLVSALPTA